MFNESLRESTYLYYHYISFKNGLKKLSEDRKALVLFLFLLVSCVGVTIAVRYLAPYYLGGLYSICFGFVSAIVLLIAVDLIGQQRGAIKFYRNFLRVGFSNSAKEAPILVDRTEKDGTEVLTFFSKGLDEKKWHDSIEEVQSALNLSVAAIYPGKDHQTTIVEAVSPNTHLGDLIPWSLTYLSPNEAVYSLGMSLTGLVSIDIDKQPMILVGGSTGSGKTKLCQVVLTQALQRHAGIYIIDFKGLDYWHLKSQGAFVITDIEQTNYLLDDIVQELHKRIDHFRMLGVSDFKSYLHHGDRTSEYRRLVVLVDECAELLDLTGHTKEEKEVISQVTKSLNTIARQGRAVGIHLIISTQRPDANAVPGSIKSNLDVRICGKADTTLSTIILGDGRANEAIPKDSQGRFIMADGAQDIIFQGFYYN